MKFSLSLQYNAVPEWQDYYINYSKLKDAIYSLQAETVQNSEDAVSTEASHSKSGGAFKGVKSIFKKDSSKENTVELDDLESSDGSKSKDQLNQNNPSDVFLQKLELELAKIDEFYKKTEESLYQQYEALVKDLEQSRVYIDHRNAYFNDSRSLLSRKSSVNEAKLNAANSFHLDIERGDYMIDDEVLEEDEEEEDDLHSENSALLSDEDFNLKNQKKVTLRKRTQQLYLELSQLKSYIELNRIGFSKITKKFDKSLNTNVKTQLFENNAFFKHSHTFNAHTSVTLDNYITNLVEFYAALTNRIDRIAECKEELKSQLRDHIVWERNTVWKDMIGMEAKTNNFTKVSKDPQDFSEDLFHLNYYSWKLPFTINLGITKIENFKLPKFLRTSRTYKLAVIIGITIILLAVKTFNDQAEHRCMALLACVALLWATEAIPLFVTSLLCPLLVVLFRVVKDDDGKVMKAADASAFVLSKMWSSTIMVLLGGFTLAAALSKYNIAKVMASYVLAASGNKPRNILFAIMSVSLFLSMWISNVATPVLCYSLIQGVLRTQPTDSPFAKSLIMGVALASNIAGMSSPISSPQNIVAMEYLTLYGVGWGQWLAVAIPTSIISVVLVWMLLIMTFNISKAKVIKYKPIREKFTLKQWFICFISLVTILLWCLLTKLESTFGESGQIAVIPIVLFFGTGLLSVSDVNNFPWSIVLLAMGSLALGKAVSSSGLLATIAIALEKKVMNFNLYLVLIIFGVLILIIGTFVSHTVSAIIIIPLVQEVGENLKTKNATMILVFSTALLASAGMGLASSGFPNVTAISMTDEIGNRYLTVNNFITRGVPASIITYVVVITVGYGIMVAIS